ncbi:MAG: NuoM family protein [Candidatus Methanofastidiosia archaeon]
MLISLVLGMVLVYIVGRFDREKAKHLTLMVTSIVFLLSIYAFLRFDFKTSEIQFLESYRWVESVGISYIVGVDGISFPLVLLTTLIFLLAVGTSWFEIKERPVAYYSLYLMLELGILGVFVALDFFLFYIFWEIVLVPMFFIIGIWGGPRKEYSAMKFFIYTHVASLVMLIGIIAMYFKGGGTFSMLELTEIGFPIGFQKWVFPLLFFGFIVKMPVVPFHTWLPDAHVEAPTPGSVILAALLLKMGGYGLIRICAQMMPEAFKYYAFPIAILALISIIYGAFASMAAQDLKRLIAYSSVSHMGYVLLGVAALNVLGLSGAIYQMVSHGLISGMLFMMAGLVHHQAGTRILGELGGIAKRAPMLVTTLVFASLASLGLPSLSGFVAEFLVFLGSFRGFFSYNLQITAVAIVVVIITAAYYLWMLQRVVFGPLNPERESMKDVHKIELYPAFGCILFIVILGLYPGLLISMMNISLEHLVQLIGG